MFGDKNRLFVAMITVSLYSCDFCTVYSSYALNWSILKMFLHCTDFGTRVTFDSCFVDIVSSFSHPQTVLFTQFHSKRRPTNPQWRNGLVWRTIYAATICLNLIYSYMLSYKSSSLSSANLSSVQEYYTSSFDSFSHFVFY